MFRANAVVSIASIFSMALVGCDQQSPLTAAVAAQVAPTGTAKPACKTDVAEWTEEVKLHDGQMVTVWRKATACKGGFPNAPRGRDIEFEFKVESMGLHWKGTLSETWIRDPVSFDIVDGVPLLALYVGDREYCRGRTKTDYLAHFLRWVDGKWVDVPQAEFPVDRVLMNLSGNYWGHTAKDDYKGLIRWKDKELIGGDSRKNPDTIKSYFERGQRFCSRFGN